MRKLLLICVVAVVVLTTSGLTQAITTTNWVEYSLNPVYTDENDKAYYPTIIKEGDLYKMWYASHADIRMTTSSDGKNWTAPTVCNGLTNPNHPLVKKIGATYRIWYWNTGVNIYSINALRCAESADGVSWGYDQSLTQDDTYKLITGSGTGWKSGSYGPGDVIYNPSGSDTLDDTDIWNNKYVLYYMATNGNNEYIGLAYSADGKHWKRYGNAPVLSPCTEADLPSVGWDYRSVGYPTVIKDADGTWHMWFCGGPNTNHGIGYAWSNDGINWTKDAANPIFHKDDGVTWRNERTYTPIVIGNQMWFSGMHKDGDISIYAIGYAISPPVCYCFGFDPPMDGEPVKVKKNKVLPLKADLLDVQSYFVTNADIAAPPVIQVIYEAGTAEEGDVSNDAFSAGQGIEGRKFEFSGSKWQYNLQTKNYTKPGTYTVTMISGNEYEYVIEEPCTAQFIIE